MFKRIVLVVIAVLLLSVTVWFCIDRSCASNEIELKYDAGLGGLKGMRGSGCGPVVEFSPISMPYIIKSVVIYGRLVGSGNGLMLDVLIWDKEQKELYSGSFAPTLFYEAPSWVEINIPKLAVEDDFYVVVVPNASRDNGVYIGCDSRANNGHSTIMQDWQLQESKTVAANWMIRVVVTK